MNSIVPHTPLPYVMIDDRDFIMRSDALHAATSPARIKNDTKSHMKKIQNMCMYISQMQIGS